MLNLLKIDKFLQRPLKLGARGTQLASYPKKTLPITGISGARICWRGESGYTLIELCICIAIIGILVAIAVPNYINYRYRAQIAVCISDIKLIENAISGYLEEVGELPDSLADIKLSAMCDPWGRQYQYLRIDGGKTPGINGKRRRDKNANPVNSDYDLYSMGRDNKTVGQFTGKNARDDIVRANDGAYYGLAENH
jgi:general secretion pathway protein G